MHSKTRLTEQSGPLFKVTKGSRLRLLGEDVAVQYNDVTSSPIYATAKGVDKQNREFYIISAMGPLSEHIDFGGFKKEKSNFIFIINILLPAKTVIVLPKHAECYLVHQEHQDYVVRGLPYFHFINVASPDHVKKIDLIKHKRQQPDLIEQAEQTQSTIPQKKQKEAEPQVAQYNMPLFLQSRRRWNELKWARVKYYPIKVIERLQAQHRQHSIEQQLANNMFAFSMCKMQRCDLLPTDRPYAVQWLAALSSIRSNHHLIVTANSQAKQEWLKELNTGKVQAGVITPQMMEMSMNDIIHQIYQSACWVVSLDEVDSKQLDFMPFNTVLLDNIDVALDLPRNCQQINFHADNAALREKQGKFDLSKLTPWAAENAYQEEYQQVQTDYCRSAMHDPMGTLLANFERDKTWPLSKAIPRPHQLLCMQQYLQTRHANQHAAFVMSTGSGKTAVFVNVAALTNDRVIVEVPRDNLVAQTIEAFKEFTPDIKVAQAYFNGDKTNINSTQIQVLVITYQLLQLHDHKVDWSKVKALYLDEAHNSLSAKRTAIVEAAKAANVKICTFTATPTLDLKRDDDDEGHEDVYSLCGFASDGSDCPITRFTIRDAIQAGANVPVVMHHVMPINFDDDVIKFKSTRSISENEAARIMDNPKCNKILCDLYLNGADPVSNRPYRGQKGVIFCSGIAHAKHVESMFDEAILSSYQLTAEDQEKITEQYYRMEEKAYVKQNRKAKNKNVPPYQRGQHWVTEEQKSKYMELAKAKCRRRLALDLIDPHGVLRKRYADNVAADFKKREGSDLSKEDWQQAYDSFRVVKAVYSPSANADIDNLSDKKCEKILKKYRLGGYLLLAGADKLTEGFDDPEVNFIAFLRPTSSERVMTQGSGRGLRVNPADNDKVCSIFQFHMTRNIASYRMVHELISEELTPIFQFGEADERRKRQGERHQQQATKVIPLPIAGLSEYHVISKPDQGQIHLPPLPEPRQRSAGTKKQRQTGTRSHARPVIEQTLIEQMASVNETLDSVIQLFDLLKDNIVKQNTPQLDHEEAQVTNARGPSRNPEGKRERAVEVPEEIREFITETRNKMAVIREAIRSAAIRQAQSRDPSFFARETSGAEKLYDVQKRAMNMMKALKDVFNTQVVGLLRGADVDDEVLQEVTTLQNTINDIINSGNDVKPDVIPDVNPVEQPVVQLIKKNNLIELMLEAAPDATPYDKVKILLRGLLQQATMLMPVSPFDKSPLMRLIERKDKVSFLLLVGHGANFLHLLSAEAAQIGSDNELRIYFDSLRKQETILGSKPLLGYIADLPFEAFTYLYNRCKLQNQAHLLNGFDEPGWIKLHEPAGNYEPKRFAMLNFSSNVSFDRENMINLFVKNGQTFLPLITEEESAKRFFIQLQRLTMLATEKAQIIQNVYYLPLCQLVKGYIASLEPEERKIFAYTLT